MAWAWYCGGRLASKKLFGAARVKFEILDPPMLRLMQTPSPWLTVILRGGGMNSEVDDEEDLIDIVGGDEAKLVRLYDAHVICPVTV